MRGAAAKEPLPDEVERAAERLIVLSLADLPDFVIDRWLEALRDVERARVASGETPTGLLDDATHMVMAGRGETLYREFAERALAGSVPDAEQPDPALARRLDQYLRRDPLSVARRRVREDRTLRYGDLFNRLAAPAARAASGNPLGAIETGRAALLSLLVMGTAPEVSTQERQALRAYREFLKARPDAPEAPEIAQTVASYQRALTRMRVDEARRAAERAMATGRPDAALLHLGRAARLDPNAEDIAAFAETATARQREREADLSRALAAEPGPTFSYRAAAAGRVDAMDRPETSLEAQILAAPLARIPEILVSWRDAAAAQGLGDELEFLAAAGRLATGDEDGYFEALRDQASRNVANTNMGRHAVPLVTLDNPYARYRAEQKRASRERWRQVMLGRLADPGRLERVPSALRPLAWVLEVPTAVVSVVTTPLRVLNAQQVYLRLAGGVVDAGEDYIQRFPSGVHAEDVHRELEQLYAARSQWSQALTHHAAQPEPSDKTIARYREKIAERTLAAARQSGRRADVRIALYRSVTAEYPETAAGKRARRELAELERSFSPQAIRISRAFIIENPEITQVGALNLRRELLDGDEGNGELAETGVVLLGKTFVRIPLEDRDPVDVDLGKDAFARLVVLLEQAYERSVRSDPRGRPAADPQRDAFFERARLGLLDEAELRAASASSFSFLSASELGRNRGESILPVEIVVRGGLEDFGVAAVPRIRMPEETEDAFLYK